MGKTKMIKVTVPGWLGMFGISFNFLVLAIVIQPRFSLAQTPPASVSSNNPAIANLVPEILSEINRVRTNPQDYAQWLEQQRQYYDGIWLKLPGEKPIRTNRGKEALEEAIAHLKQQSPLPPLETSNRTTATATSQLENFANSNNIQFFSYGRQTASGIVMDLVVDELFPDRRRRQSLLSDDAEDTGVVCKPDPRYAKVCAIAYSDSPQPNTSQTTTVAQAPVVTETPAPPEKAATTPIATPPVNPPTSETQAEPPAEKEEATPEVVVQPEETEATKQTSNPATPDLPVPPEPQAPPTPTVSEEPQPSETEKAELEEEQQIAQAESEIAQIEQEQEELAKEEDQQGEEEEVQEEEPEETEVKAESEEPEESEEAETNSEELPTGVIDTEAEDFSEKVEEGELAKGDRVITDDGSLYDFYPIRGKAGESLTIDLESDDFDAFVALVDSNGKTVGENDDISEDNGNSQLEVTLPEDGIYNVIVNTYDENGTGKYVLKVSR